MMIPQNFYSLLQNRLQPQQLGPISPQGTMVPMPFEGWMPGWGGKGGTLPSLPTTLQPQSSSGFSGSLGAMIRQLLGRVSGSSGTRGPDRNPFVGLARFAGPFGNGGGPLIPTTGQLPNMRRF